MAFKNAEKAFERAGIGFLKIQTPFEILQTPFEKFWTPFEISQTPSEESKTPSKMSKIRTKFLKPLTFNLLPNSQQIASLTAIAHSPTNSRILTLRKLKSSKEEFSRKVRKIAKSFHVSRVFTRIFSFVAYKIRCLLSVVRCQVKKIRVDTWDSWSFFRELCVFARNPWIFARKRYVQIREIRGVVMKS